MSGRHDRIPSLDGLRAISIALVLYGHLNGTRGFPRLGLERVFGDLAHLGVTVFFVISGFLITSLLISERDLTGRISLKRFYQRRALRIFPAFYAFVLAMIVATAIGWAALSLRDLEFALTYTVNYFPGRSWDIGHLWSLSIEEQFYLLWPLLFLILSARNATIAALIAFIGGPLVRTGLHLAFPPHSPLRDLEIFPAMADSIAIGCLLAMLRPRLLAEPVYLRLTASPALALLLPLVFAINRFEGYSVIDLVGTPVMLVSIAILIEASTRHADAPAGRALNSRPLVFVGALSYSLYLWQQPFLDRASDALVNAFPFNIALALAAALISYFALERPLLGLRRRIETTTALPALPEAGDERLSATHR